MCRELKTSLNDLMGWTDLNGRTLPLTHRQQTMWDEHLRADLNAPSRTDHYIMQVGAILLGVNSKGGKIPPLDEMKLEFGEHRRPDPNAYHPPGCPRPIRDQADLDRIRQQMFLAHVQQGGSSFPGPKGEGFDAPPHPLAVRQKQQMIDQQQKETGISG